MARAAKAKDTKSKKAKGEDSPKKTKKVKAEKPAKAAKVKKTKAEKPEKKSKRTPKAEKVVKSKDKAEKKVKRSKADKAEKGADKKSKKAKVKDTEVKKKGKKAVAEEDDEDETPIKKKSKKELRDEAASTFFNPYSNIDSSLDGIDKDLSLSGSSLNLNEQRMSTGLLGLDLVVGKGMVPGWYTFYGPEQSCKSTGAMLVMSSALTSNVPIKAYFDYEGSGEPNYIENMLKTNGIDVNIEDVFGVQDPRSGKWIKAPMIRYQKPQVAERFFDYVFKLEKMLPDKISIGDDWYFVYDDTKDNRKLVGDAFDKNYWRKTKKLRVPAADGTPQAIVVVDSYPAMLPERLDDEDAGAGMAAQARMFSEQIKRIKGRMGPKRIIIVGVNQLRQRPAVMYGCLHGSSIINLVDGRALTIEEIVKNKVKGKVWSVNEQTGAIEAKRIIDWHDNGQTTDKNQWIKITARNPHTSGGFNMLAVTPDHEVFTSDNKWIPAKKLKVGDKLVSRVESKINGTLEEFLTGTLVGDATLVADSKTMGYLRLQDNENPEYVEWKKSKLENAFTFTESTCGKNKRVFISERSPEFVTLKEKIGQRDPTKVKLTALGLAVLYMDDGTLRADGKSAALSFKRFKNDKKKLNAIAKMLKDTFGLNPNVNLAEGCLFVPRERGFDLLMQAIHKFVPPCMQYKLAEEYRGKYRDFKLTSKSVMKQLPVEVTKIEAGTDRLMRAPTKYDISVEGNANYMAGAKTGGFIVHNSPEYEPCGDALKFYSDCRLRFNPRALSGVPYVTGKGMVLEEPSATVRKGKDQYRFIHVRGVKNKLGMPYLETWVRLWIEDGNGEARGFDPVWDTFMYLDNTGQVSHKGRKKIMLKVKKHENAKPMEWMDFKTLIVGTRKQIKEVCERVGLKPFDLRAFCRKQLGEGDGMLQFIEYKKSGGEREEGDEDGDSSTDSDDDD